MPRIAVYLPTLDGGGAESSMLRIAEGLLKAGWPIDLVVNRRAGALCEQIPTGIRVIELARQPKWAARFTILRTRRSDWALLARAVSLARYPVMTLPYMKSLARYLQTEQPALLISAMFYTNLMALWARDLVSVHCPIVVTEHTALSARIGAARETGAKERIRWRALPRLIARTYPRADAIVAVSNGVADELAQLGDLPRAAIRTIYNPVVTHERRDTPGPAVAPPAWFEPGAAPVILAAGRLEPVKDFATLIAAFAQVRTRRPARLVILGEGRLKSALQTQAQQLGIADDVDLAGWVDAPRAFMHRAAVFVLASRWEGLGNVLVEAMSCGCPVVSTDCPHGPREILADGRYGRLVRIGDAAGLAIAIEAALDTPVDRGDLIARAERFSVTASVSQYVELVRGLLND